MCTGLDTYMPVHMPHVHVCVYVCVRACVPCAHGRAYTVNSRVTVVPGSPGARAMVEVLREVLSGHTAQP